MKASRHERVEVRRATHDGFIWVLAKVVDADERRVLVEYPGGHRAFVPLDGEERIREPQDVQA